MTTYLQELPLEPLRVILSHGSFLDLVHVEQVCTGRMRHLLRSEGGRNMLETLLEQGGRVSVNRGVASHSELKTLLSTLSKSPGVPWTLQGSADVTHAVAAACQLDKSCLWPSGRMWSDAKTVYGLPFFNHWPRARNRWSSHSKRALFTIPRDPVEYIINVWERRQVPDLNNLPAHLDGDGDQTDFTLEVSSNHVRLPVACLNGISMQVEVSIVLSFRAFPPTGSSHLFFIVCLRGQDYRLQNHPLHCIADHFYNSDLDAGIHFAQSVMPPDLCFLSLQDDAVVREPLCVSHFGLDHHAITRHWRRDDDQRSRCTGLYDNIFVEELDAQSTEALPHFPERLKLWLQKMTKDGMRSIIAIEDLNVL